MHIGVVTEIWLIWWAIALIHQFWSMNILREALYMLECLNRYVCIAYMSIFLYSFVIVWITHARAHTPMHKHTPMHAYTLTHARTDTHTHKCTHAHTWTHTQCIYMNVSTHKFLMITTGQSISINMVTEVKNLEGCLSRVNLAPRNYTTNNSWWCKIVSWWRKK